MKFLILVGLLLFETSLNLGHVVPNIHRYNGTGAFEIREDTESPVRILVPKADNSLTLREIIYYHLIERPYDKQKENKGDEVIEENKFASADEMRRPFTNSHGFQFLDSYDKDQSPLPQKASTEDSSSSSDEIDEIVTSVSGPNNDDTSSSSNEDEILEIDSEIKPEGTKIREQLEKNDGSKILEEIKKDEKTKIPDETEKNEILITQGTQTKPIILAPTEKKRISRKELFDEQKHRYEVKAARHKRDLSQAPLQEKDYTEDLALSFHEILTLIYGSQDDSYSFTSYEGTKLEGTKPDKNDGTKISEESEKSEVNKSPEKIKKDEKTKIPEEIEKNEILTITQGTQTEPISLTPAEKKNISRMELFDEQEHRYEVKAARHKRDLSQADIPPPPSMPPPFDYKSYLPVDIRKRMLERSTAKSFQGDENTMMNKISSQLSRMFDVDEPQSNKETDGELQKYHGPTPRTYGVNLRNGEGYVWNGLWSNPPLKYRVGENAPEIEDLQTSNPSESSEEIICKLADLFTEIENLTNNDGNDDDRADDNDSSVGNDEENNDSSDDDVTSYDDDGVDIPDDHKTSSDEATSSCDNENDKSKQNCKADEIKNKKPKQVNNDEVLEDDGSYKPVGECDSNDKPLDSKEVLPSEDPQANYDIEFLKPKNNNAHVKYIHESSDGKQSESKDSEVHRKPINSTVKGKSIIPNEESSNEKKKDDGKKKDPKKGFFKGQFTLDKYDTSNNNDYDHLEEKYRVKDKIEGKRIDTLVEIMKDEQFWKWLAEWTSTYMEVLTKYIKKIAQEEIQYQMKEWENNHHRNVTPNREESEPEQSKNDEKKPAIDEKSIENRKNPEKIKDKQKHEELKPSRDSEEYEDAIIIDGKKFPLTHNSDLDEIDEVTQYLKGRKNKDGNNKPNITYNKEKKDHDKERNKDNKDKDNIQDLASNKTIEEAKANKTAKVESAVIYGNSVNSDSVTNIFLFYPNGELKQTQHIVPHKNHIKPNKEEAESNKIKNSTPKTPGKDKPNSILSEEKSTTPKTTEESKKPEADNKVTEAPKSEEKFTSTVSPIKDEIKKGKPELPSENKTKTDTVTEASTKAPDTKPSEDNKQITVENIEKENTKTQDEKKIDESKKNSDSEKIESKTENNTANDNVSSSTVKPEDAKADSVSKNDKSDSKKETDTKKDESDSTKESDSKKDKSQSKKEADTKKDETDSKKEIASIKDESESKKDDDTKKDASDSKKDDSDSNANESDSKKGNDSKKEIEEEHTDASKDEKKDSRR